MSDFFGYFFDPLDIIGDTVPDRAKLYDPRNPPKKRADVRDDRQDFAQLVAVPGNLPNHVSGRTAQSGWVKKIIDDGVDVVSIAECSNELGAAIRGRDGVFFSRAQYNFGGNGNAFATSIRPYYRGGYDTSCHVAIGRQTFHMARIKIEKHGVKTMWDAVHIPSSGGFRTSANDANRRSIVRQIALNKSENTDGRFVLGDWNGGVEWVLSELRKVDKRWEYLGGTGVMLAFGIGGNVINSGTIGCPVSDHRSTVRLKIKVKE